MDGVRIDKWLWAARFFKTRTLAQEAIEAGRVLIGGERVKLARPVHIGDDVTIRIGDVLRVVTVMGLSDQRGPAPVAQNLYEETPESARLRAEAAAERRLFPEPGAPDEPRRPPQRDRRDLDRFRSGR
ncbi:MAG TPA: RNA-binding S4 domain-containing protein [Burkholderiaceae bacterium]|nr:RNA-binding S4 domain-containing protein [Burkholderiaceae bacterium]